MTSLKLNPNAAVRSAELLKDTPKGFALPAQLAGLNLQGLPELRPVFWLSNYRGQTRIWSKILRRQYPGRHLLPIAKTAESDDVYCLDVEDPEHSSILLIHSFASAGWEYRGEWSGFDSWLRAAQRHHVDWTSGAARGLTPWDYP